MTVTPIPFHYAFHILFRICHLQFFISNYYIYLLIQLWDGKVHFHTLMYKKKPKKYESKFIKYYLKIIYISYYFFNDICITFNYLRYHYSPAHEIWIILKKIQFFNYFYMSVKNLTFFFIYIIKEHDLYIELKSWTFRKIDNLI